MPTAAPKAPAASKPLRGRARRVAKWIALVVCVLVVVTWAASLRWNLVCWGVTGAGSGRTLHHLRVRGGAIWYGRFEASSTDILPRKPTCTLVSRKSEVYWRLKSEQVKKTLWWVVPLWIPFSALLVPTSVLWVLALVRVLRRHGGLCSWCGYDLKGLTDPVCCPECGAAVSSAAKAKT